VDLEKNTQKTGFWRKAFVAMTCSRFSQGIIGYKIPFLYLSYPSLLNATYLKLLSTNLADEWNVPFFRIISFWDIF